MSLNNWVRNFATKVLVVKTFFSLGSLEQGFHLQFILNRVNSDNADCQLKG